MCGISGIIDTRGVLGVAELRDRAKRMAGELAHRGPDGRGLWIDAEASVALGFRRLAVLDLTSAGAQPMVSTDGRFVLVFNGEIYNHRSLRADLERGGARFRGRSDTEVLLAAIQQWGPKTALERCNGMFAFAVWDRSERALILARDAIGEKPLYYGIVDGAFVFGSELKALQRYAPAAMRVDPIARDEYFRTGYVPAPYSIYRGISKLLPGTWLRIPADVPDTLPVPTEYWSVARAIDAARATPFVGTDEEGIDALDSCLQTAVAARMDADVPVGAFLSGGVDSATVVALMQSQSTERVRTFTIASPGRHFDEGDRAREIARYLGTQHEELVVAPNEAAAVIPDLAGAYDEPFGDSTAVPTYMLARFARSSVTVSLSGDGGDEIFGGYHRHVFGPQLWQRSKRLPRPVIHGLRAAVTAVSPNAIDRAYGLVDPVIPRRLRQASPGTRLHRFASSMTARDLDELHARLSTQWQPPHMASQENESTNDPIWRRSPAERLMYLDQMSYLPDNNLAMLDRATMAWSLEARVPILDRDVVALSWRLPAPMKVRGPVGKWVLRQVLDRHLPPSLTSAPKQGFAVDIASWLRGPLRDWAESLLGRAALEANGIEGDEVRAAWHAHLAGRRDASRALWIVLMYQSWAAARA